MTAQTKQKFFFAIGALVILLLILLATGILKFDFYVNVDSTDDQPSQTGQASTSSDQSQPAPSPRPDPLPDLIIFSDQGSPDFTIQPPRGWQNAPDTPSNSTLMINVKEPDFIDGQEVRANVNVLVSNWPHQIPLVEYKDNFLTQMQQVLPSATLSNDRLSQVNGMDVFIIDMEIPGPEGIIIKQAQYLFFVNSNYIINVSGTAAKDNYSKYQEDITSAIQSISLLNLEPIIPEL